MYERGKKKPYTGKIYHNNQDGKLLFEMEVLEGKLHGNSITYYGKGAMAVMIKYENGEPKEEERYSENGLMDRIVEKSKKK